VINKVLFVQDQLRYGFVIEKAQDPHVSSPLSLTGGKFEKGGQGLRLHQAREAASAMAR
ncbi:uncharacterized protein METZ01_LOCUS40764, partial [marine metagenome]